MAGYHPYGNMSSATTAVVNWPKISSMPEFDFRMGRDPITGKWTLNGVEYNDQLEALSALQDLLDEVMN
jgi:hypothetical protein